VGGTPSKEKFLKKVGKIDIEEQIRNTSYFVGGDFTIWGGGGGDAFRGQVQGFCLVGKRVLEE